MVFHGGQLDIQARGDLLVGQALIDQLDDLQLPGGKPLSGRIARRAARGKTLQEHGRQPWRIMRLAARHLAYAVEQILQASLARYVPGGPDFGTGQHVRLGSGTPSASTAMPAPESHSVRAIDALADMAMSSNATSGAACTIRRTLASSPLTVVTT